MFDESEEEPIVSPDTENATHFHAIEAPPDERKKYQRFHGYNTGVYNGEWQDNDEIRRLDNLALYDAVSSQLELSNYQKRRGRELFDSLNLNDFGHRAILIIVCICSYVCREDGRVYHPSRSINHNDELFVGFVSELDESPREVAACYERVVGKLP